MTQQGLADAMPTDDYTFSLESVGNIERGRTLPALETLARLAEALAVTMSELLDLPVDGDDPNPRRTTLEARLIELARLLPDDRLEIAVAQIEHLVPTAENEPIATVPQRGRGGRGKRVIRV